MDEKAPPSFFVSLQSPDRPLLIPCAERARPLFVIYHTPKKNGAACCSAVRARMCWCAGATFDVSFRVHSSSSSPSQGCEYPSMSPFRVRVQWVRRTRTRIRVRVYRPRRTRTRNSHSVVALVRRNGCRARAHEHGQQKVQWHAAGRRSATPPRSERIVAFPGSENRAARLGAAWPLDRGRPHNQLRSG